MPKVAKTEPGADIYTEGTHFVFGDDGSRQVSEAEIEILRRYERNGGPFKIDIIESRAKGGKS